MVIRFASRIPLFTAVLWVSLPPSLAFAYTFGEIQNDLDQANYPVLMQHFSSNLAEIKQDGANKDLQQFYNGLSQRNNAEALKIWAQTEPHNHIPWTAMGLACLNLGETYRGSDVIQKVSKEKLALFNQCQDAAKANLDKAVQLNPDDPCPYVYMMEIGSRQGWPKNVMEGYFQKAIHCAPQCQDAIWNMAIYKSPLWEGSAPEMRQFVDQYGRSAPKGSYLRLLIVRYHEEIWHSQGSHNSYFGDTAAWREIKRECEDYLSAHPEDLSTHSWYSFFAYFGGHYTEAKQQFDVLGDRWNMNPFHWLTKEAYMKAKDLSDLRAQ